jgi:hypothetical protein
MSRSRVSGFWYPFPNFHFFIFFSYFYRQRKINVLYINIRLFQVTRVILDNVIFYRGRKLPGTNRGVTVILLRG